MGDIPPWYGLVRAARYLGVAPWDLAAQDDMWEDMALLAESAEIEGQNAANERANN